MIEKVINIVFIIVSIIFALSFVLFVYFKIQTKNISLKPTLAGKIIKYFPITGAIITAVFFLSIDFFNKHINKGDVINKVLRIKGKDSANNPKKSVIYFSPIPKNITQDKEACVALNNIPTYYLDTSIEIQYFPKAEDSSDSIIKSLKHIGYSHFRIDRDSKHNYFIITNYILYGDSVPLIDIKAVAYCLIKYKIQLKLISKFNTTKFKRENPYTIQIGSKQDTTIYKAPSLNVRDIDSCKNLKSLYKLGTREVATIPETPKK